VLGRVIQLIDALADELVVAARGGFLQCGDAGGDFHAFFRGQKPATCGFTQGFRGRGQYGFGFGARFDQLALGKILLGVFDGFLSMRSISESLMP